MLTITCICAQKIPSVRCLFATCSDLLRIMFAPDRIKSEQVPNMVRTNQ